MVVEARSEAQMPERMLFSCKVSKLDMSRVVEYPPRPTPGNGHQDAPEGAGANSRGGEARNGGLEGKKVGGYRSGAWWLRGCLGWSEPRPTRTADDDAGPCVCVWRDRGGLGLIASTIELYIVYEYKRESVEFKGQQKNTIITAARSNASCFFPSVGIWETFGIV
eukprot:scaffold6705_cov134-Isochrysis_galbana.AAC.7